MEIKNLPTEFYSIDTNSLMDWQARYYPTDVFKQLVKNFDSLIENNKLVAAELVKEEAEKVGTAELVQWVKDKSGIFVSTQDIFLEAQNIQSQFKGLLDPKADYEEADAYVIALAAKSAGGIVVTQETSASEKNRPRRTHFIPDVCREMGVPCISILGLMRREKWVM